MQVIKKTNFKREATYGDICVRFEYGVHAKLLYARFFVLPKLQNSSLGVWFILIKS